MEIPLLKIIPIVLVTISILFSPVMSQEVDLCPPDDSEMSYFPCACCCNGVEDITDPSISCYQIPLNEVANVFQKNRSTSLLSDVSISLPSADEPIIPANILGNYQIKSYVKIYCNELPLVVDQKAFSSSTSQTTTLFHLYGCDLKKLDWVFLESFQQLKTLEIYTSSNIHVSFSTLPELTRLNKLEMFSCDGVNELTSFPKLVTGSLSHLSIYHCQLNDQAAGRILDWVLLSSNETLPYIGFAWNNLTKIPSQICSFTALQTVDFNKNQFQIISDNSFCFKPANSVSPYGYGINLQNSGILEIEIGAFEGDYSRSSIYLDDNQLTRFKASVFQNILQEMAASGSLGPISIGFNPIDCSYESICHLSWLFNDEPDLLNLVKDGRCSNGTIFNELQLDGFKDCPHDITSTTGAPSSSLISNQSSNILVFHCFTIFLLVLNSLNV